MKVQTILSLALAMVSAASIADQTYLWNPDKSNGEWADADNWYTNNGVSGFPGLADGSIAEFGTDCNDKVINISLNQVIPVNKIIINRSTAKGITINYSGTAELIASAGAKDYPILSGDGKIIVSGAGTKVTYKQNSDKLYLSGTGNTLCATNGGTLTTSMYFGNELQGQNNSFVATGANSVLNINNQNNVKTAQQKFYALDGGTINFSNSQNGGMRFDSIGNCSVVIDNGTLNCTGHSNAARNAFSINATSASMAGVNVTIKGANPRLKASGYLLMKGSYACSATFFPEATWSTTEARITAEAAEVSEKFQLTFDGSNITLPQGQTKTFPLFKASKSASSYNAKYITLYDDNVIKNAKFINFPQNYTAKLVKDGLTLSLFVEHSDGSHETIDIPAIASKNYTGLTLKADISNDSKGRYIVSANNGGINAGHYTVTLKITDTSKYRWPGSESATIDLDFEIKIAENKWTTTPSISPSTWTTVDPPGTLVDGIAAFGSVTRIFDGNEEILNLPTTFGQHTVTYTVEATSNWTALEKTITYNVSDSSGHLPQDLEEIEYTWNSQSDGLWETYSKWNTNKSPNHGYPDHIKYARTIISANSILSPITITQSGNIEIRDLTFSQEHPEVTINLASHTNSIGGTVHLYGTNKITIANGTLPIASDLHIYNDNANIIFDNIDLSIDKDFVDFEKFADWSLVLTNGATLTYDKGYPFGGKGNTVIKSVGEGSSFITSYNIPKYSTSPDDHPLVTAVDGGYVEVGSYGWWTYKVHNITLRAEGEGANFKFKFKEAKPTGYPYDCGIAATNNIWEALNGGTFTVTAVQGVFDIAPTNSNAGFGADVRNTIIVSNGTFIATSGDFKFGCHTNDATCVEPQIVLAGTNPVFNCAYNFSFGSSANLALPPKLHITPVGSFIDAPIRTDLSNGNINFGDNLQICIHERELKGSRVPLAHVGPEGSITGYETLAERTTSDISSTRVVYELEENEYGKTLIAKIVKSGFIFYFY